LIIDTFLTPHRIANKLALRLSRKGRVITPKALRVFYFHKVGVRKPLRKKGTRLLFFLVWQFGHQLNVNPLLALALMLVRKLPLCTVPIF
jgi:hypothetical protein